MDIEFFLKDNVGSPLDLHHLLVSNPASTFFGRVRGCSMTGAGVDDGDIVVIDKSLEYKDGALAVCILDGGFTLKYIRRDNDGLFLVSANPDFPPIPVCEDEDGFNVFGVVTYIIKPQNRF